MNNIEFVSFLDEAIHQEILLGPARNKYKLEGLRNIKSDFNYITSKELKTDPIDVLRKLYKEREENAEMYKKNRAIDLWMQENTEAELLKSYLPEEPDVNEVITFLNTLDFPKQKSSFKKFQEACTEKFKQKIDSNIILDFINS